MNQLCDQLSKRFNIPGVRDLAPPPWSLKKIAEELGTYPVLLLLSPGADPGPELNGLASNHVAQATGFMEVSLGQGQVAQAEAALEAACRYGEKSKNTETRIQFVSSTKMYLFII